MANYKRKRCRYNGRTSTYSNTGYRVRCGLKPVKIPLRWWKDNVDYWPSEFNRMGNTPSSWNICYHTRPRRAAEKRLAYAIRVGRVDPEEALWPVSKKPHIYYW